MNGPNDQETAGGADDRDPIDDAAQDWFLLLTSGDPTEDDRARFETWYTADPRHTAAYDELSTLWADIDDLRGAFAPPGAPETIPPNLRPHANGDGRPARKNGAPMPGRVNGVRFGRRQAFFGGLVAACMALLVVMSPQILMQLRADHITGVGEQARIDLPDGSVVWLNTDTAIAVAYTDGRRDISLLQGEAQFEVAKDAARPFAVLARRGRSTALGTVFAVRDDGGGAVVAVSEGQVELVSPIDRSNAATMAETAVLTVGERVRYAEGAAPGPVRRADPAAMTAWRDGFIAIRDLPLSDALAEIDRYHPGRIVLMADSDGFEPVTARLSIAAIDDGLDALAATHGLGVMRLTGYLFVVR